MSHIVSALTVIDIETEALAHIRQYFDARFETAITLFLDTLAKGGKIVVTGIGKNLPVAEKISATLASTGSTSVVLNPAQAMHGDLGILAPADTLLALSYSGESEEIKTLIPAVKRLGIKIVALTGNPDGALATLSDCVIQQTVPREACPFNMAPTASTTAALAIGDAVAMTLLHARGFKREDYARLHPAGAIGRALLLRAGDVMRAGGSVATVPPDAAVKDVVVAMTKAKGGAAFVVDASGKLIGIYTDGDFRRGVASRGFDLLGARVSEVMTPNPVCVRADTLAVEVLREFEKRKIDDLPVTSADGLLLGAIDIQDLPKMKVM
ncbi:MAG: KpsF/GutQ family sugar-phosphate isomerase [Kiritimatiellaeota bacterium]|nr:KpsF/GutQ family sugar-phosphate isomerase [Kiritimatiellota bacterium]